MDNSAKVVRKRKKEPPLRGAWTPCTPEMYITWLLWLKCVFHHKHESNGEPCLNPNTFQKSMLLFRMKYKLLAKGGNTQGKVSRHFSVVC